jgi:predicted ester cyclase
VTNEPTPDTTTDGPTEPSDATSVERNKAVSRRWIEVFNERNDAAEADVRAQDYVAYAPVSLEPTPLDSDAWTRFLSGFVEAFPDLQLRVEVAVGEGDLVAQRVHFEGTHTGEFKGFRLPTGKSRSPASSSTDSSTAESRSTGSKWTPSHLSSSWVW